MTVDQTKGAGELYDLAADPDELVNQFDNPQSALRDELMEMLETSQMTACHIKPKWAWSNKAGKLVNHLTCCQIRGKSWSAP